VLSLLSGAVEEAPACSSSSTAVSCCCQSASWSAPDKLSDTALRFAVLALLLLLLVVGVESTGVGDEDRPWEGRAVLGVVLREDLALSSTCSRAVSPFPAAALSCFDQDGDPTGGTGTAAAAAAAASAAASAAAATAAACCAAR
jgi:hypothetical protein